MKKINNMELIVEMGMVDNKKTNNNIVNTTKRKKRSVDSNKCNENKKFTLVAEMNNNRSKKIAEMSNNKSKKRSVNNNKNDENKKFTLVAEMNNNRSKKIAEMSNNKSKKGNHDIVNTNKSKKRSVNNNKRDENKKFTLEYFAGKCVEIAATKGFKIRGTKMLVVGMFEINGETYLLTVNEYGVLFWVVDLGTLVIAVTRYLSKSQDDNYDLNCHCISTLEAWKILEGFY